MYICIYIFSILYLLNYAKKERRCVTDIYSKQNPRIYLFIINFYTIASRSPIARLRIHDEISSSFSPSRFERLSKRLESRSSGLDFRLSPGVAGSRRYVRRVERKIARKLFCICIMRGFMYHTSRVPDDPRLHGHQMSGC